MQSHDQNSLYKVIHNHIPKSVLASKNKARTWLYGYNNKYDVIVISRDGTIGEVYYVNGLYIGLPKVSKDVFKRSGKKGGAILGINTYRKRTEED